MSGQTHLFDAGFIPDDHQLVVFVWSNVKGHCYECGIPAAFAIAKPWYHGVDLDELGPIPDEDLRCSVCAANAAAEGEPIIKLFEDD